MHQTVEGDVMVHEDGGPLALVRRGVDDNEGFIGLVTDLRQRRDEIVEIRRTLLRHQEEVDRLYQRKRSHLQGIADRLNARLASMARHPRGIDQRELLDALLLVLREFDGYDEDVIDTMREYVLHLMALAVESTPVLTLTGAGWVGSRLESDVRLKRLGTAHDKAWRLVLRFVIGEKAVRQFTISLEVCDDDLLERLAEHDLYVGEDAIRRFLTGQVVQPHALGKPGMLRQAVVDVGLDGDLCNNIVGA